MGSDDPNLTPMQESTVALKDIKIEESISFNKKILKTTRIFDEGLNEDTSFDELLSKYEL